MKVYEVLGIPKAVKKTGPFLGLECETEGRRLPHVESAVWDTVPDHSLRNGLEYVSKPIKPADVVPGLTALFKAVKEADGVPAYSFRCSTHVHINVQDFTEKQLMNMIFLYMMYENVFMNYVADERVGNRFCLRFQDAQHLTHEVTTFFRATQENGLDMAISRLRQENLKYAAMNLYTLRKYGTLEFRALEGTDDVAKIDTWVQAIVRLRSTAMKWETPQDVYAAFLDNPTDIANDLFGHAPDAFLKPGWHEQVEEGYSQNQAVLMAL